MYSGNILKMMIFDTIYRVFVSFPNWFLTVLLLQSKVFLSSLCPRLYTNRHSDIINSIFSTLSGFLTKKLSAKNCGSMINQQTTFNLGFYNSRVFLSNESLKTTQYL